VRSGTTIRQEPHHQAHLDTQIVDEKPTPKPKEGGQGSVHAINGFRLQVAHAELVAEVQREDHGKLTYPEDSMAFKR